MNPNNQTPQKPTNPDNAAPEDRPAPWTPPEEGAAPTDPIAPQGDEPAPTEPAVDVSGLPEEPAAPEFGVEEPVTPPAPEGPVPPMPAGSMPGAGEPTPPMPGMPATPPPENPLMPGPDVASTQPGGINGPTPPTPDLLPAPASQGKRVMMLVVALIVVVVLAVGGYFGYKALKKTTQKGAVGSALTQANDKLKASGAIDLSTANSVSFVAPASALASAGLTEDTSVSASTPTAKEYVTADQTCFLTYGTNDAAHLPGSNVADIVNNYLDTVRKAGATTTSPTVADPRIFKGDNGKQYGMPSLNLSFSQGAEHIIGDYSGVVLKSGQRAILETGCLSKTGAVDPSKLAALEPVVKQLTIAVK
ncbi:MAG TPA: hypothetical protein VLG11_01950 [Candidatus Saccharimonadales bacterium]|nr:hypothetical protein [Candidatus Saccharimonadales bacterium]